MFRSFRVPAWFAILFLATAISHIAVLADAAPALAAASARLVLTLGFTVAGLVLWRRAQYGD